MNLREAEIELYGACKRMQLDSNAALYVLLKEYERLKIESDESSDDSYWEPPEQLP